LTSAFRLKEIAMTTRSFLLCVALLSPSQSAFAAAPSNDRVNRATPVSSLPFQDVLNTSAATTSMNDPVCVGQGPTVWFRYRASQDGPVTANTFGSDYDTTLSVYTSTPGRMLTQIACNDDDDGLQSSVLFQATAGVTYYMMVGAYASGPGGQLTFSVEDSPVQPAGNAQIAVTSVSLDAASGRLVVAGTATCTGSSSGYIFGDVTQKHAGGEVRGFFGLDVVCGQTAAWRAVSGPARPVSSARSSVPAAFRRGNAVVSARGWIWNESTGEVNEPVTVNRVRVN
jgi:hypothetical protein